MQYLDILLPVFAVLIGIIVGLSFASSQDKLSHNSAWNEFTQYSRKSRK